MKIKRLEIVGFKSFPERTQVLFPQEICAVVGPNGCGKSNIVDAIRWVMGEQSAKQLRGRQMEDVLFSGANGQPAAGLAEVALTLANDGAAGADRTVGPSEITITRRLYRSGESEYLINKVPCRLKDIVQLFMDTGMGTRAYSIIEQGRIGNLVDLKPEERRSLIDEAAGITRYKAQKKEAERKIEATEQNLVHIETLMAETKRQINALKRAARKAARYKELRAELQEVDLAVTAVELAVLDGEGRGLSGRLEEGRSRLSALLSALERAEVDLENTRLKIVEQEKAAQAQAETLFRLKNEFSTLGQEEDFLRRKLGENNQRQAKLTAEREHLAGQGEARGQELSRVQAEAGRLAEEVQVQEATRVCSRAEVAEAARAVAEAESRREELGGELVEARGRLGRLEEVLAGQERMSRSQAERREGIEAEIRDLQGELERAAQAAQDLARERDDLVQARQEARARVEARQEEVNRARAEADRLAALERRVEADLAGLASRLATLEDLQANFGWYPEAVQALMTAPEMKAAGVLGPVAERLEAPAGYEAALEAALGDRLKYILVQNRRAAAAAAEFLKAKALGRCGFISLADLGPGAETDLTRALVGEYTLAPDLAAALAQGPGPAVLTREGDFVGPGGLVVAGGAREEDRGLLARRREIEDLGRRVGGQEAEKERLASALAAARAEVERLAGLLAEEEGSARGSEQALFGVESRLSAVESGREETARRLAGAEKALASAAAEAERLAEEKEKTRAEREALEAREFDLRGEVEAAGSKVAEADAALEAARERDQEVSLELSRLGERVKTVEREEARLAEWLRETESRAAACAQDLAAARREQEEVRACLEEVQRSLAGFEDRLGRAEEDVAAARREVDELRSQEGTQDGDARRLRRERESTNEELQQLELQLQEIGFKKEALFERIENEYRIDLAARPEEKRPQADPNLDLEEARQRREKLRRMIEGMGEVNLTAIGEHEALKERYDFYRAQYEDLTTSIEHLRESIRRVNRTCKIRFMNTFQAVDQKLREIFPLLFEGGEAWLSLTEESQPLESGVEIQVHPPGKKVTVMSLLSGGEKALVALALIFALYLIRPSPFCLLDEIDAPLDEANIDRFTRLLAKVGQSSQVIMITHNKRTMQMADKLYGVTMERPGISTMVGVTLSEIEAQRENGQMVQAG